MLWKAVPVPGDGWAQKKCGAQAPAEPTRMAVFAPWHLPSSLEGAQVPGIALDSMQGALECRG